MSHRGSQEKTTWRCNMVNIIFLILALLGAILAFGPGVLDAILVGVAGIDFVSVADLVIFGVLVFGLAVVCSYWAVRTNKKYYRTERIVTWITIGVVGLVYVVLLCSLWADGWLERYQEWTTAAAKGLQYSCYAGWLGMVCSAGYAVRAIYERYFKSGATKTSDTGEGAGS